MNLQVGSGFKLEGVLAGAAHNSIRQRCRTSCNKEAQGTILVIIEASTLDIRKGFCVVRSVTMLAVYLNAQRPRPGVCRCVGVGLGLGLGVGGSVRVCVRVCLPRVSVSVRLPVALSACFSPSLCRLALCHLPASECLAVCTGFL